MAQSCNDLCIKIVIRILSWIASLVGLVVVAPDKVLADGCRQIPTGHFNFDPSLAEQIGLPKAIIYQRIAGRIDSNRKYNKNLIGDQIWSYNTYPQWAKDIRLYHQKTIEKHIRELEALGMLNSAQFDQVKGNPRKYYTSPLRLSDDLEQMLLWPESRTPEVRAHESALSSLNSPAMNKPSTIKAKTPTPTAPAYAAMHVGDVVQFGIPTGDLPEGKKQTPEVRDAQDEHEAYDFQGSGANASAAIPLTPVSAPPPSPPEVDTTPDEPAPTWMDTFFNGCSPSEIDKLVREYGEDVLRDAKIFAENPRNKIDNPAGFVRAQLAKGWRPPVNKSATKSYTNPFDSLREESTEHLQWVVSDDCKWLDSFKRDAREILTERGVELAEVAEV